MLGFQAFSERSFSSVAPFTATVFPADTADTLTTSDLYDIIRIDWGPTQAEVLNLVDAQTGIVFTSASVAETLSFADTQAGAVGTSTSVAEALSFADTQTALFNAFPTTAEILSLVDAQTGLINTSPTVAETLSLVDAQAGAVSTATSVAETVSLTDAQIGNSGLAVSVNESTTLTDTASVIQTLYGLNFQGFSMMPFSTTSVFVLPVLPVNTADTVTSSDVVAVSRTDWATTQTETMTVTDSQDAFRGFFRTVAESLSLSDTFAGFRGQFGEISDNIVFADVNGVQVAFNTTTAETFVLIDSQVGRGWFKIVDTQDPGWTLINNTQI